MAERAARNGSLSAAQGNKTDVCYGCGRIINGAPLKLNNRLYCAECYGKEQARQERETADMQDLFAEMRRLYSVDDFPNSVVNVVKRLRNRGYKYRGMLGTLLYYYEVKGNPVGVPKDIGWVISDNYEDAKAYVVRHEQQLKAAQALPKDDPVVVIDLDAPEPSKPVYNYKMEDL
jgi:hypothetical protein